MYWGSPEHLRSSSESNIYPSSTRATPGHFEHTRKYSYSERNTCDTTSLLTCNRNAQHSAHHRAHLAENAFKAPKIMHSSTGHHEHSHWTGTEAHDMERTARLSHGPGTAAPDSTRPAETNAGADHTTPDGPAPLQLRVVLSIFN